MHEEILTDDSMKGINIEDVCSDAENESNEEADSLTKQQKEAKALLKNVTDKLKSV